MSTKIKQEALAHYDRMIEWAKKQPPKDEPFVGRMLHDLGETYSAKFCVYCNEYKDECLDLCMGCPLSLPESPLACCNGQYRKMCCSDTWAEWVENAKEVRRIIKKYG